MINFKKLLSGSRQIILGLLITSSVFLNFSCKKTDSLFTNKLQFGESVNLSVEGWPIVDEKYIFYEGHSVTFRLETKDDFGNSDFKLVFTPGGSEIYPSLQDYGHIYSSTFRIPTAGTYTVAAYVVNGNKLIDTKTITILPD
jgi:hypothetical protein